MFEDIDLDPNYYIGWGDFDFCMQIKEAGWKIAVLSLPSFKSINDCGGPDEYSKYRMNPQHSKNSMRRFYKKWGISII